MRSVLKEVIGQKLAYVFKTKFLCYSGTVVDIEAIFKELAPLEKEGISCKGRLLISDRAQILFDFHKVWLLCLFTDYCGFCFCLLSMLL